MSPPSFYEPTPEDFIQAILSASDTWEPPVDSYDSDWRGSQVEWDDDEYACQHPDDPDTWEGDEKCVN